MIIAVEDQSRVTSHAGLGESYVDETEDKPMRRMRVRLLQD